MHGTQHAPVWVSVEPITVLDTVRAFVSLCQFEMWARRLMGNLGCSGKVREDGMPETQL